MGRAKIDGEVVEFTIFLLLLYQQIYVSTVILQCSVIYEIRIANTEQRIKIPTPS